jgi:hypothetical protein
VPNIALGYTELGSIDSTTGKYTTTVERNIEDFAKAFLATTHYENWVDI